MSFTSSGTALRSCIHAHCVAQHINDCYRRPSATTGEAGSKEANSVNAEAGQGKLLLFVSSSSAKFPMNGMLDKPLMFFSFTDRPRL
jgi:hypothetical protein